MWLMAAGEQVESRAIRPAMVDGIASRGVASTAIDEVLLSVLSLALALVLIRGASKAEYGVFALVSGIILLLRCAQNALVLTPLATLGARLGASERGSFVRAMSRLQAGFGAALALLITAGVWIAAGHDAWLLAVGSGLALAGNWLREYRRGLAVLDGQGGAALAGDALFAVLAATSVIGLWSLSGATSAGEVLAASGVAAGAASFLGFPRPDRKSAPAAEPRRVARLALDQGRWTLPGMAVAWGQSSGYAYAVALLLGSAAVGGIVAARLFVIPLLLVGVAWSRISLPRFAALLADGGDAALRARGGRTLRVALAGSGLYLLLVAGAFLVGIGQTLPPDYAGCEVQVLAWSGFAVANLSRTIASTALLARLQFRALFAMSAASAAASMILVVALIGPLGAAGAIIGLTAGEFLLAALCWRTFLARPA
jgi:O-antigen/teichoic acid export membrane protein